MAVTREDVLHIADLARLGVDETRAEELTKELTSILGHMEVLSQVDTAHVALTAYDLGDAVGGYAKRLREGSRRQAKWEKVLLAEHFAGMGANANHICLRQ